RDPYRFRWVDRRDPDPLQSATLSNGFGADVGIAGAPLHQAARGGRRLVVLAQERGRRAVAIWPSGGAANTNFLITSRADARRARTGSALATDKFAFADVPDATTILGAAKLTGRTAGGLTLGVLEAVTGQETARVESASGQRTTQEVEPRANYYVGRVKRDFLHGDLVVGGIVSGVARNLDTTLPPRLARHAEMYGEDLLYQWADKAYSFMTSAAITNVSGNRREILLRQRSSARYFQRPD